METLQRKIEYDMNYDRIYVIYNCIFRNVGEYWVKNRWYETYNLYLLYDGSLLIFENLTALRLRLRAARSAGGRLL